METHDLKKLAAILSESDQYRVTEKYQKPEFYNTDDASNKLIGCLLYTSPSPRDLSTSRMPSSA